MGADRALSGGALQTRRGRALTVRASRGAPDRTPTRAARRAALAWLAAERPPASASRDCAPAGPILELDAVRTRAVGAARPRRAARPRASTSDGKRRSARSRSTRSRAWRTGSAVIVTVLAQLKIRGSDDARAVLRRGQRLLPELDRRQPGPLQEAADRAHRADADRRRDRLRDRVLARAARPPPALADPADHADHRHPLHAAERRRVLPAAAAHRPRQGDRADRARLLLAADHLPQRDHGPGRRPRRGARRRPRHGPDRAPAAVAGRAAARAAGDHGRAADRGHDHRRADRAGLPGRRRRPRRGDLRRHRSSAPTWSSPAGCACCWRSCSTCSCSALQKALTPWTRAAAR